MKRLTAVALYAVLLSGPIQAGVDFGTLAQSQQLADQLIKIIDADGIEAGVMAVHDPARPFAGVRLGINLFQGSVLVADNREPEMVAADYTQVSDLNGVAAWPAIVAAADDGGSDTQILWYHYDTQAPYLFDCFSKRASRDAALVMICR